MYAFYTWKRSLESWRKKKGGGINSRESRIVEAKAGFHLRGTHNCETLSIVTPPSVRFLLELFITGFSCLVATMFLSAGELVAKIISKSSETDRQGLLRNWILSSKNYRIFFCTEL